MNDSQAIESVERSNKLKLIWGLVCLIGPTALIVVALVLYAVVNFIAASTAAPVSTGESGDLFGEVSPVRSIGNVLLFLVGAVSIITWLPGIVVGIILLATRKSVPQA